MNHTVGKAGLSRFSPLLLFVTATLALAGAAQPAAGAAALAAPAAGGDPLPLLRPVSPGELLELGKGGAASQDPEIARRRAVRVDAARLFLGAGVSPKSALRVELALFDDAVYTATLTGTASQLLPYVTWRGPLDGDPLSQVVLVARADGRIAASIQTRDRMFQIVGTRDPGVHSVEEIDLRKAAREADPLLGPDAIEADGVAAEAAFPGADGRGSESAEGSEDGDLPWLKDEPTSFDLLGAYTSSAAAEAEDPANLQSLIMLGVEQLNTAFERSRIDLRARLVQIVEIPYQESDDIGVDLVRLRARGDGFMDGIHALRDSFKADVVALVRRRLQGSAFCGMGFILNNPTNRAFESSAFSVTAANCVVISYTLAHEIGHNLGCNHAREDPTGTGAFPYSYAFKDIGGPFRTLMAYNCFSEGCPPVLHFSNPEVLLDGRITGTEREDNALSIQNVRALVANFRAAGGGGGGSCNAKPGPFAACQGGGCSVCAMKIASYPKYLERHPDCNLNTACKGKKFDRCSKSCPKPTNADR